MLKLFEPPSKVGAVVVKDVKAVPTPEPKAGFSVVPAAIEPVPLLCASPRIDEKAGVALVDPVEIDARPLPADAPLAAAKPPNTTPDPMAGAETPAPPASAFPFSFPASSFDPNVPTDPKVNPVDGPATSAEEECGLAKPAPVATPNPDVAAVVVALEVSEGFVNELGAENVALASALADCDAEDTAPAAADGFAGELAANVVPCALACVAVENKGAADSGALGPKDVENPAFCVAAAESAPDVAKALDINAGAVAGVELAPFNSFPNPKATAVLVLPVVPEAPSPPLPEDFPAASVF
mmetsp:Transcript_6181/g.8715  ORF Transcript_6181/g.8715 Transcript_6181/m.8715 type:complete len:298 (+) Transcript_6181:347-1240(+)